MKSRQEIIEANYRRLVSEKIYELMIIMSPNEQMKIGEMSYSELLKLAAMRIAAEYIALIGVSDSDGLTL